MPAHTIASGLVKADIRRLWKGMVIFMGNKEAIQNGKTSLGIEFGSTRIKAVLNNEENIPIAVGSYEWENQLENGIWTYHLEEIENGLKACYQSLCEAVKNQYDEELTVIGSIGISAMMHGYMVFDKDKTLLVPFRTWRNAVTEEAAQKLTEQLHFNIPQRWSIAHLYQAILNREEHVKDIAFITTLAGYIHWRLTGKKVLGIGDASGMFPIDNKTKQYDEAMLQKVADLIKEYGYSWQIKDIFPQVLIAGEQAGSLTQEGAAFLDASKKLRSGIPFCPPEGDAQTGMVATNSVAVRTGNVSAGTSVFAMVVLENALDEVYPEIDMVVTPTGNHVAMVHCNNCTSDLNSWVSLFGECLELCNAKVDKNTLFEVLFKSALSAKADCGGLMSYNYLSGENIMNVNEGRPLLFRSPKADLKLFNFMRTLLYSSLSTLKIGTDILFKKEGAKVDKICAHGGLFKTQGVGQRFLAAALNVPITVLDNAGEGGAWGMAVLASYMQNKKEKECLEDYMNDNVFQKDNGKTMAPDKKDVEGFDKFVEQYKKCFAVETMAIQLMSE